MKDLKNTIEAFAEWLDKNVDCNFYVIGKGDETFISVQDDKLKHLISGAVSQVLLHDVCERFKIEEDDDTDI